MAFETATSALAGGKKAFDVVAQNVATSKNNGIKYNNFVFHNTVAGSAISSGKFSPGTVSCLVTQNNDLNGPLKDGTADTHLAFDSAKGFFVVSGNKEDPNADLRYTRDGDFTPDAEGNLRNSAGYYLMGWRLDNSGLIPAGLNTGVLDSLDIVNVTSVSATSTPTSALDVRVNLPATAVTGDTHRVTSTVIDSQGASHSVRLIYTKTANPNEWDLTVESDDTTSITQNGGAGSGGPYTNVTIQFDSDGRLVSYNGDPSETTAPGVIFDWSTNDAADSTVTLDFGAVGGNDTIRILGNTAFTVRNNGNGRPFSTVSGSYVSPEGDVYSVFRSSDKQKIFTIAVAIFNAPNQLEPQSGNTFTETVDSGGYVLGRANDVGFAKIISGKLEGNPTSLADELTKMIDLQHYYASNARAIQTEDKMLETLKSI